jgi:AAA domain-containing protein
MTATTSSTYSKHNAHRTKDKSNGAADIFKRSPLNWAELAQRNPPPREWFIQHWLGAPGNVLFAGRGGIGKSLLAQQIGTAAAMGIDFIDHIERPLKVLMWACEDEEDELWRRQVDICGLLGIELAALSERFIVEPRLGLENTLFSLQYGEPKVTPLFGELVAQINDYKADMTILDNVGQIYGANENDRHHVTSFSNILHSAYHGRRGVNVLIGHPSRSAGSEFSGNAAWENAVRMRWFLSDRLPDEEQDEEPPKDNARVLAKRKTNYSSKDYRRFNFENGVLVPEQVEVNAAPGMTDYLRRKRAESTVLAAVPALNSKSLWTTHSPASRERYLPKRMLDHNLATDFSRRELEVAMRACIDDGRLLVEQELGRNAQRHPIKGLKVCVEHA